MATVDLTAPPPPPVGLLDALPRRVGLSLPELQLAAERAGGAPLPFDALDAGTTAGDPFEARLGLTRTSVEDHAYLSTLATLHDPTETLTRRGLLDGGVLDEGLAGALGLLATPSIAVDLDVVIDGVQARAWHREAGGAVATLATVDGVVFELAWFPATSWAAELARAATLPHGQAFHGTTLPDVVDLPFELLDAAGEAVRSGRADLLPVLATRHSGSVVDGDGRTVDEVDLASMLSALVIDLRGRLRALGAGVSGDRTRLVGVVSWVLLADGWRALRPHRRSALDDEPRVEVRRVAADDLAHDLAFVLAEVVS
jgi:hypothetical protein